MIFSFVCFVSVIGCGKTNLITSILSRTNCPYQYHCQQQQQSMNGRNGDCGVNCEKHNETTTTTADTNNIIKQCYYSQTVQFREIEIQLKVFERTCNGQLDRSTIQPYYHRLDAIIGVYDLLNYQQSFNQMRMALDSILALYNDNDGNGNGNQRPTVFVLGNVGDNYRRCRQYRNPYDEVKEYVNKIGAIQLFNYCYSTQHIKAFHHVFMLNIYRQHFRQQLTDKFEKAIENCRKHVYNVDKSSSCSSSEYYHYYHQHSESTLTNLKNLFKRIKIPHHFPHHHHYHQNNHHHNRHSNDQCHHGAIQAQAM